MNNYQDQTALRPGIYLNGGKYVIEGKIAQGGFGITYKAKQSGLDRAVCIKEYYISGRCVRDNDNLSVHPQNISEEAFEKYRQAFVKEARTLASLQHPGIVEVIEIFDENNTSYMVMPFIEGQSLQTIVDNNGPLDYPMAVNYIAQVADAVDYIHKRHILHRDIKPDNIMITAGYKAMLIDFGSAREFVEDKTQAHTSMLTHGYAPTEQYSRTSRKGSYTDIYALGATMYFILTGTVPVESAARLTEPMPEPCELNPKLPKEANRTIMKAMQLKPQDRHQSIAEFMDDLLDKVPSSTRGMSAPKTKQIKTAKPPKKKKNVIVIVACIVMALAVIGSIGYVLLSGNSQSDNDDEYDDAEITTPDTMPVTPIETKPVEKEPTPAADDSYYVYATHLMMRSEADASTKANIIVKPSFGSIIHIPNPDRVRYNGDNTFWYGYYDSIRRFEGYVAKDYLMSGEDFALLESILGDENAVDLIGRGSGKKGCGEARYKRALLNYFKKNGLNNPNGYPDDWWVVYCRYPEAMTNNVYHGNASEGEVDFAVIIENIYTGKRRLLSFCFDSNENVSFMNVRDALDAGYLQKVDRIGDYSVQVYYDLEGKRVYEKK